MLIRIIYVSKANSLLPLELKNILASCRKNNQRLGITGAMCLIDGIYLQCLEGPQAVVDALYQKIEEDSRSSGIKLLERCSVTDRTFPHWAMALLTWNEETQQVFRRYNTNSGLDVYQADPATIYSLLQAWSKTTNWMTV
jgi:Sensors of blue-light using FAD